MELHLKSVWQFMERNGLDGLLLVSRENKCYTAGLYSGSGYVLLTQKGCYSIVDGRYYVQQKERMAGALKEMNARVLLADKNCGYMEYINRISKEESVKKLGFEAEAVSFAQYQKLKAGLMSELVPVSPDSIRMVKTEDEIFCISRACEIADRGYSYILGQIKAGMTEKQVENRLIYYMKELGAQKESFDVIVASGINGAMPHAKAGHKVIEAGDFVTMDFGVRVGEYCSDITRTIAVQRVDLNMRRVYETVKKAQETAIRAIGPGKKCSDIDRAARDVIEKAGYGPAFSHNLGHGLGIACHELPDFAPGDERVLVPGMVMTVEPGIYLEGQCGVRIEDDVLVTEEGCRLLTSSPRELTVVG
ncbi:M24 family metallopeptidase [Lacrimispora celerecrescens]|uniref:M24 family metallopeptidase n=1 Tax=Lacrimispora celerecrescens TaxID=29354 RepID=UPI0016473BA2|nr:M24 family metallopeptidase [Lacrimispora celerecrescens]